MGKLTIELPESLQRNIEALAAEEGCSVDQFLASAAAEKMSALRGVEFLREEAAKGNREAFEVYLKKAGDGEPSEADRLV